MPKLLQSAADWCFCQGQPDPATYYRKLAEIGYTAAEMVPEASWDLARAAGLKILNLTGPSITQGLNRQEHHAVQIPQIKKLIQTAAAQGIPQVIVFSGNRAGQDDQDGIRQCAAALKELAGPAEKAGVTLTLEVLNAFDHADYQCDHSAYAFAVVRAVGSPNVRVLYDIYHMHRMGEDVQKIILDNLSLIGHLHIAGSPKRDFPSLKGVIDYAALVRAVHQAGYYGYWGQEFLPTGDPLAELRQAYDLFNSYA